MSIVLRKMTSNVLYTNYYLCLTNFAEIDLRWTCAAQWIMIKKSLILHNFIWGLYACFTTQRICSEMLTLHFAIILILWETVQTYWHVVILYVFVLLHDMTHGLVVNGPLCRLHGSRYYVLRNIRTTKHQMFPKSIRPVS